MSAPPHSFDGPRLSATRAALRDAGRIQACFEGARDYFQRMDGKGPASDAALQLLVDAEGDDLRAIYVMAPRGGGPTTGMLDLHFDYPEPGIVHVGLLLLREACRNQGHGREVLESLAAALDPVDHIALRAAVVDENAEAAGFWEAVGFSPVGRLERGITLYEKKLG